MSLPLIKNPYGGKKNYIEYQRGVYQETKDEISKILRDSKYGLVPNQPDGGWFLMLDASKAKSLIPEKYFNPGKYTDEVIP